MTSGVYQILNTVNGKCYVGSSVRIEKRWLTHKSNFNMGTHPSKKLSNAVAKYGILAFEFSVLEECQPECVLAREEHWIAVKNATAKGYNTRFVPYSNLGIKVSDETKAKQSVASKGRKHTPETIARQSAAQSNRSDETRKKQSEAQKGKPRPWLVGQEFSKDRAAKISDALTGRKLAPGHIEKSWATRKLNDAADPSRLIRAPMSEAHKANVRAACTTDVRKQQWATRRENKAKLEAERSYAYT